MSGEADSGTNAPVTLEGERCLWPPSHGMTCFADAGLLFPDVPAAQGLPIRVVDCRSNQPDDNGGRNRSWWWRGYSGDGNTVDDCVVAADQASFCVRAERSGAQRQGREYLVTLTLDCGGVAYSTIRLLVPHDMREQPDCTTTGRSATRTHPRSSR